METLRTRWPYVLLSLAFVVAMVGASVALDSPEVLFPEMCAVLCGAWVLPRQPWRAGRPLLVALLTGCAALGVATNLWLPLPLPLRALLGYAACGALLAATGSTLTPVVSAAVLPMLLGTTSWAYPLSVCVLAGLVATGQAVMERRGLREPSPAPLPAAERSRAIRPWPWRLAAFVLLACPAYAAGMPFLAVPPLLVAFTELSTPGSEPAGRPVRCWAVLALAGTIGCLARDGVELLGMAQPLAAGLGFVALVAAWAALDAWLPPAGALVLLALLVPWSSPWLYAVEVAAGAAVWVAAGVVVGRLAGRDAPYRTPRA